MYQRILHATDGSAASERAAETALELAETLGATLDVTFVVEPSALPLDARSEAYLAAAENEGRETVDELVDRAAEAGGDVVGSVVEGHPADAICTHATESGADLIVVGTHGRTGVDRVLLGSVAARVVRHAAVPVLTVPPAETA
ncbi:MAG: universal stress protein [Haloarculaceae archaeon]